MSYCLFETPLGTCGIAWSEPADPGSQPAVTFFQLPEATPQKTESHIAQRAGSRRPSAPPPRIAEIMEKIRRHLRGEVQDFRDVAVDLKGVPAFARQVYEAAREIPAGQTRTYGEIAKVLGQPAAAQEVGQALSKNPVPLIVPCHRVSAAAGKLGGFPLPVARPQKPNSWPSKAPPSLLSCFLDAPALPLSVSLGFAESPPAELTYLDGAEGTIASLPVLLLRGRWEELARRDALCRGKSRWWL